MWDHLCLSQRCSSLLVQFSLVVPQQLRPRFYIQEFVRERREGDAEAVRNEGQVCGWCWHPGKVWEEKIWEAPGHKVGQRCLPTGKSSRQGWQRCCQIKKFLPIHPKNFPGQDLMGVASKFGNAGCLKCRERGRSRGWRFLFQSE